HCIRPVTRGDRRESSTGYPAGRSQLDTSQAAKQAVLFTVRTSGEVDDPGFAARPAVACGQAPQPVDEDVLTERIRDAAQEPAGVGIERVNSSIPEISDQDGAGKLTETRRGLHQAPRRIEVPVLRESRQHAAAQIENVDDAVTWPRNIVVFLA